jgi:hypothetical protein
MIQRYVIHNTSATVTVDGQKLGPATAVGWCTDEDVTELEANHYKLLQAHTIMKEALEWLTTDACFLNCSHASKRQFAVETLKRVAEVMK